MRPSSSAMTMTIRVSSSSASNSSRSSLRSAACSRSSARRKATTMSFGNPLIIKKWNHPSSDISFTGKNNNNNNRRRDQRSSSTSRINLWTEDDPPGPLDEEDIKKYTEPNPEQFLLTSVTFYILMTAASQTGCDYLNIHPDLFAQVFVFNPDMATIWSIPLLLSLAVILLVDEKVEFVKEVKEMMVDGVIPNVAPNGANGILMLSLGAGIGEEALFRGFLMPLLSNGILERGLGGAEVATYASLGVTSVIFGALHAITPAYQIWATMAGFLFGWEYLNDGLGSAMFTHCFYDFIAFAFIILLWGKPKEQEGEKEA